MSRHLPLFALATVFCAPALAQEGGSPAWSGEGAFNAGYTTGNTKTRDAGVGVKLTRTGENWIQAGEFAADYGQTNGTRTKNRIAAAAQLDRIFTPRWSGYARVTWEEDEFTGFDNRWFFGVGAALQVVETPATKWRIEGGPGYRIDKLRATGETEERVSARLGSRFNHAFNERVSLSNDSEAVYADNSTLLTNTVAMTANLMGNLSARVSFNVRHDTDPVAGFEKTDTATKFSLVYKIG